MAGRNPAEAVTNFLTPLQHALSCVARGKFTVSAGGRAVPDVEHALVLNNDDGAALRGGLHLWVRMRYRIVQTDDPERGPWKVSTSAYDHVLQRTDGAAILSFHWHPTGNSWVKLPHVHLGAAQLAPQGVLTHKTHVPTNRVPLEDVIGLAISDLGVEPLREDWSDVLDQTKGAFLRYRSWP